MSAYYNEIDPYPAQWLRNLSDAGHIAKGVVDERSIVDLKPEDVNGYTQAHFFAGIGGWSHALRLADWSDDAPVWTGSCPCQPFSSAGKGGGAVDHRHLWPAFFNLIRQCQPTVVFGEQVAGKGGLAWVDAVQADMESEGYAFGALELCACGFGAPHKRQRLFWVGYSESFGAGRDVLPELPSLQVPEPREADCRASWREVVWPASPDIFLEKANGVPARVGRLRAYGNAIVPQVAAAFIRAFVESVRPPAGVAT